ncbi:MAG: spore coat associated protein CotJA [Anaerovoracaceae bacterium]
MNKKEPYIGMPIDLNNWDDMEIVPDIKEEYKEQGIPSISNFENFAIAMAYVPWQRWRKTYELEKAFQTGTIFPDLDLPFRGYKGGMER